MINCDLISGVLHPISRCGTLSRSHSLVTIHTPETLLTCDWFLPLFQHLVLLPISYDKLEKTSMYLCSSSWTVPVFSSFTSAVTTDKADTMLPFLSWNSKFIHWGLPNWWLLITEAHHNTCSRCISSWLASATKQWLCSFLNESIAALSTFAWLWYSSGCNVVLWRMA